jgi:hypothetical protein
LALPELRDRLHAAGPAVQSDLVEAVEHRDDAAMGDEGPPQAPPVTVAQPELVGQPLQQGLPVLGPGGELEDLGHRGRGVPARDIEQVAHEHERLGCLARPRWPEDDELAGGLVGGEEVDRVTAAPRSDLIREPEQLGHLPHAELHLHGMLERSLQAVDDALTPDALDQVQAVRQGQLDDGDLRLRRLCLLPSPFGALLSGGEDGDHSEAQ